MNMDQSLHRFRALNVSALNRFISPVHDAVEEAIETLDCPISRLRDLV
jgi:hypothetical protein